MPRSYVNNASNRSLGRVGMPVGSMPVSRGSAGSSASGFGASSFGSGSSTKTYVDNASNRNLGRVGMPVGSMPVSRGSAGSSASGFGASSFGSGSSTKTYVDNASNRNLGRVGMPVGSMPVSRGSAASGVGASQSSSPKTYVDNAYNRSKGRVGMEHGTAVISKNSTQSQGVKLYVDNAFNRRIGRVGLPVGSMVVSRTSRSGEKHNKKKPTPGKSKDDTMKSHIKDIVDNYIENPEIDVNPYYLNEDDAYSEEVSEQAIDLIHRMDQIRLWQQKSNKSTGPMTSYDLLQSYRGEKIQFDELILDEKIGHGGFGDVHCATWKGTVVAVKKLRVQRVSQKRLEEFASEIKVFCTLDHPNIVQFLGACCVTPNIAIVMEFMEGCLFQMLHMNDNISLTEDDKLSIIVQICRGLDYLHANNIAHCDIKSQNVLMATGDRGYVAKITDFGLSMMRNNSDTSSTNHDQVRNIGTPRYSAPEVLRGELLDRAAMMRADMYSLGLVVFEVISQDEPFDSLNAKQIERLVGNGNEMPVFGTDVEENVEANVKTCWSRDPFLRPSSSCFRDTVEKWECLYM
ncbi:uncharacterized protein LOC132543775 [Ylistrum balloti]|uniref:uncharacterized protein LOC132543775 n=1 Tax=Ylistrum balloti TaxID=509963 RepID=UPI002905CEB6|nr:uncharacterized protein LOC132543775 [Ylistrum balloti]